MRSQCLAFLNTGAARSKAMIGVTSGALIVAGLSAVTIAAPAAHAAPKPAVVTSAPTGFAAMMAAQRQGSKVLVTDETTPTQQTWANPDGTYSSQITTAPVRYKTGGSWTDIDRR